MERLVKLGSLTNISYPVYFSKGLQPVQGCGCNSGLPKSGPSLAGDLGGAMPGGLALGRVFPLFYPEDQGKTEQDAVKASTFTSALACLALLVFLFTYCFFILCFCKRCYERLDKEKTYSFKLQWENLNWLTATITSRKRMMLEFQGNDANFCSSFSQRCPCTISIEETVVKVLIFDSSFSYRQEWPKGKSTANTMCLLFLCPFPHYSASGDADDFSFIHCPQS